MLRKYLYGLAAFVLAFAILTVSVLSSAHVSYGSALPKPSPTAIPLNKMLTIEYQFPYPGRVMPNNVLWYIKAIRDKVQLTLTTDPIKKADLALLFSDKRIQDAKTLFEQKDITTALSTLSKGEKYLEIAKSEEEAARANGKDTHDFLTKLATASLKHRQIIEENILPTVAEAARPEVTKSEDYSKDVYRSTRDVLISKGFDAPKNPFTGD